MANQASYVEYRPLGVIGIIGPWNYPVFTPMGSISYALAAAGLVSSPLDSTSFMSWGEAGPGKWITVYANAGHAFMVIAGLRFDTSGEGQSGPRWRPEPRWLRGFHRRHPAGL
jgi:delta 1-pyrroline-5-carboxylate dehydrogenase